jgi:DNA-binding transcriptional LysR family regulator
MITISQLRTFVAVARHRHFTRAAEELQIAQPSVSYQIQALERVLKVRLIEVVGRRVYLTDAGERLAARGTAILNDLEDVARELRDYGAGVVGRLRLGATRTIGGYALPNVVAGFHAAHAKIELHVTINNTLAIEEMLLDRAIDLGVVEWHVTSPDVVSVPLRRDALVLIAPPDHPLANRPPIRREDLSGQPFILREPGSGTRALSEDALGAVASTIVPVLELADPEAIVRAVEAGMGLAFISKAIVAHRVAAGTLRTIPVEGVDLWRDFSLVSLRDRPFSPAMQAFSDFIASAWGMGKW